jgi:hypothetical protein
MASWRCPHCGSPQLETARCWVCRRSTISCASCRQFRKSVAGRLGYCAFDKRRTPLTGDEERACWERKTTEFAVLPDAAPSPSDEAEPAAAADRGLWDTASAAETPFDTEGRARGMWTESDSIRSSDDPGHQHGSSDRSRPWGPVPGSREPTGWRRGIRAVSRKG